MNRITLLTLGSAVAACSWSSPASPSSAPSATPASRQEYDDTAQAVSSTTVPGGNGGDVGAMADALALASGAKVPGLALQSDGRFHGQRLGVDSTFMVSCKDSAGTVLAQCDATTNEATVTLSWSGNFHTSLLDATVMRDGMWTITGLQTATATFSGDSSFSSDSTLKSVFRPGTTVTYMFDTMATYTAIQIDTKKREIIGGSASFDVSGHHTATGSGTGDPVDAGFAIHAEITFHADHTADLVLDGAQHYTINLMSGTIVRVN